MNSEKKYRKKFVACLKFQSEANHRTRLLHSFFAFRISYSFEVRRGVILYRELSAAPTAAFPTNLLEINRAFSQQRVESAEAEAPKIYDSILGIGRSKMPPSLRQMQPKRTSLRICIWFPCLSLALALTLPLLLAWPEFLETAGDGHAMKSTLLLPLLLRLRVAWDALFFLEFV